MNDSIDDALDTQPGDCWVGEDDYDRWLAEVAASLPAYDGPNEYRDFAETGEDV